MKISSASKKVLASALSAAMVVAFAPTVALAKPAEGNVAKIHFEVETGANASVTDAASIIKDVAQILGADGATTAITAVANQDNYKYYGAKIIGWWYDKDADGVLDPGENLTETGAAVKSFTPADSFKDGDTITLKAIYDLPAVTASAFADTAAGAATTAFKAAVKAGTYDVKVTKDGADIFAKTGVTLTGTDGLTFAATDESTKVGTIESGTAYIAKASYGSGKYVVSYTDKSTGYAATAEFSIYKVTLAVPDARSIFASADAVTEYFVPSAADGHKIGDITFNKFKNIKTNRANGTATPDESTGWVDASGEAVSADTKVTGDVIFTSEYADAKVSKPVAALADKKITFGATNLKDIAATGATEGVKDYTAEISGPGVSFKLTGNKTAAETDQVLNFGASYTTSDGKLAANVYTSAAPQAGTYTYTLTQNNVDGTSTVIGTKSIELVAVTYDLGEGAWKDTNGKDVSAKTLKTLPTVAVKGEALSNSYTEDAVNVATQIDAPKPAADSLNEFDKWAVSGLENNGKAVTELANAANNVTTAKAYKVTGPVTLTATYKSQYAAAPTASISGETLTVEAAAGTVAYYKVGTTGSWVAYSAPVTLKSTDTTVAVKAYAGTTASKEVTFTRVKATDSDAANYKTAKQTIAGLTDFATPATYLANSDVYKKAVEAADATFGGWNKSTDWTKVVYTATGTVLGSYADIAEAAIDGYAAGVEQKDGSVSKLSAEKAADAKAAIASVEAAWLTNNGAKTDNDLVAVNGTKPASLDAGKVLTTYTDAIKSITDNAAKAMAKIAKADVDAAKAFDAQVAKLAADYAEVTKDNYQAATDAVIDAQKSYSELSEAAKGLIADDSLAIVAKVASDAAVIAQQVEDEEAAQKLADAQDLAAARQLYSKTVTAKAKVGKKAQGKSFTYKLAASESGAVATYSKASGSKYIKVSKSGKVTFSKVKASKKAKTYKAKVTVTYGTQTATKTVTYKVKKK